MKYFDVILDETDKLQKQSVVVIKLSAIEQAIKNRVSAVQLDTLIEFHLHLIDESRIAAQAWYEQHQLVSTLDENMLRKDIVDVDGNITGQEPNGYDVALVNRTELEDNNTWLKGLRGIASPGRPLLSMTVEQFKLDNSIVFKAYNKALGVLINGISISLNASNQHGLADIAVMLDKIAALGQTIFPINISMETMAGAKSIVIQGQDEFDTLFITFGLARQEFFK